MAKVLAQSGRRILPCLTYSNRLLETNLERSTWLTTWEANSSNINYVRLFSAQARAQQTGNLKVAMISPGFIYEPYSPREKIPFWRRWFTKAGWNRTKEDLFLELKSAYAIAKLRKSGYSKQKFYKEAAGLYQEINTLLANGDKGSLRKYTTEIMHSTLKNEIKHREKLWSHVYWELMMPLVKIRTLRARLIGVDKKDLLISKMQHSLDAMQAKLEETNALLIKEREPAQKAMKKPIQWSKKPQ